MVHNVFSFFFLLTPVTYQLRFCAFISQVTPQLLFSAEQLSVFTLQVAAELWLYTLLDVIESVGVGKVLCTLTALKLEFKQLVF